MAATSVTGKGRGAADGQNKGSDHMTLGVGHLIGPRVVAAGSVALSGGAASVVLPELDGSTAEYGVLVTDATAAAAVSGSLVVATNSTTITLAGTGTHTVCWAVVKLGI